MRKNVANPRFGLETVRLISKNLYSAFINGKDIDARSSMSMAALLAGITISVAGICAGHAAAYAFAVKYALSHGLSCAISLPYIMKYNAAACLPKIVKISNVMGEKISSLTLEEVAEKASSSIVNVMKRMGLPHS